jgi:short-subunit dehydrogenase
MTQISKFGPWAIVTGASSGLGKEFSHELAAMGINVVLIARDQERLTKLANNLGKRYAIETKVIAVDLCNAASLDIISKRTRFLDIGLLISNAGDASLGAFIRNSNEKLKSMLQLNVVAQMELAHMFCKRFRVERKHSGLLMVSSAAALQGVPYSGNYSGAKAYVICLGEALNYELKQFQINVSVLIPGPIDTPGLNDRKDIDLARLPGPVMSTSQVVKEGLRALSKNKATHIAGLHNRLMVRLIPRKILVRLMGWMMSRITPTPLS